MSWCPDFEFRRTQGLTKVTQEVHLDKRVKLLDSPGIVFTTKIDSSTALRNCVKVRPPHSMDCPPKR